MKIPVKISASAKLRAIALFNHGAVLWLLAAGRFSIEGALFGYGMWVLSGLAITIGYHRYWSHRAFSLSRPYELILMFFGTAASLGPVLTWAGVHRMHHAYEDTEKDPHSPRRGFWKSWFHVWPPRPIERKFIKDLISDPLCRLQRRFYFPGLAAYALSLFLAFGEKAVFVYCLPAVLAFHATGLVNSFHHRFGEKKPGPSSSTNFPVLNFLTLGESFHASHHSEPGSYSFGKYDFAGLIISRIKK